MSDTDISETINALTDEIYDLKAHIKSLNFDLELKTDEFEKALKEIESLQSRAESLERLVARYERALIKLKNHINPSGGAGTYLARDEKIYRTIFEALEGKERDK